MQSFHFDYLASLAKVLLSLYNLIETSLSIGLFSTYTQFLRVWLTVVVHDDGCGYCSYLLVQLFVNY